MEFFLSKGILFTNPIIAGTFLLVLGIFVWKNIEFGLALLTVAGFFVKAIHFQSGVLGVGGEKALLYPFALYVGMHFFVRFRDFRFSTSILRSSVVLFFFLFVFSVFVSYLVNPPDEYSMHIKDFAELLLLQYFPFLYVLILSNDTNKLNKYINCVFWVAAGITTLFGWQILEGIRLGIPKGDLRMLSVFGSYLGGGAIVTCLCMIISLLYASLAKGKRRIGYTIVFVFSSFVFLSSLTRIYFVGMAFVIAYLSAILIPKHRWVYIFPLLLLVLFLVVASLPSLDEIGGQNTYVSAAYNRLTDTLSSALSSDSFRMESYMNALSKFDNSPFFGSGVGNAGILGYVTDYNDNARVTAVFRASVHSLYVSVLAEQGLIGAALLFFMIFSLSALIRRNSMIKSKSTMFWKLKVIGNSTVLLALISGITGTATFLFWGIAIIATVHYRYFVKKEKTIS